MSIRIAFARLQKPIMPTCWLKLVLANLVKVGNGFVYNLDGQRVDNSYKGIVIKNGQKFIQR